MRRALAAPAVGVVHDVVVEQCEGVHQFESRSGVDDDRIVRVAAAPDEGPMAEGRTQALTTREHESPDLGHRLDQLAIERRPPAELRGQELLESTLDALRDRPQAGGRVG